MSDELPELRASDADRERVAEQLRDAVAEGRIDMAEFDERLEAVYRARTYGELKPLTRDLPAGAPRPSLVKRADPDAPDWSARIGRPPTSGGAFAFWSGFLRKGRWSVARRFTAFAMWGGGEIDLRDASFEARDTEIRCFTIMGGIQVKVPPGLNVQVSGFGLMGGFGDDTGGAGDPDAPRVKVTGLALMGGVGVVRRLPREVKRKLREEERLEREERRLAREERRGERRAALERRREEDRERRRDR